MPGGELVIVVEAPGRTQWCRWAVGLASVTVAWNAVEAGPRQPMIAPRRYRPGA